MWPYVTLGGHSHVIPAVCPNCLAEADEPVQCFHKDLIACIFYPFGPAAQTFFYCKECADAARAGVRYDRLRRYLTWMFPLLALLLAFGGVMALIIGPGGPLHTYWEPVPGPAKLAVLLVGIAGPSYLIAGGYRRRQKKRFPKTGAQAVWGVAAYYTSWNHYKAARPEWIEALVRCNPGLVGRRAYRRFTGEDRPE